MAEMEGGSGRMEWLIDWLIDIKALAYVIAEAPG